MKQIFPSCERLTVVSDFRHWENMLCVVSIWGLGVCWSKWTGGMTEEGAITSVTPPNGLGYLHYAQDAPGSAFPGPMSNAQNNFHQGTLFSPADSLVLSK